MYLHLSVAPGTSCFSPPFFLLFSPFALKIPLSSIRLLHAHSSSSLLAEIVFQRFACHAIGKSDGLFSHLLHPPCSLFLISVFVSFFPFPSLMHRPYMSNITFRCMTYRSAYPTPSWISSPKPLIYNCVLDTPICLFLRQLHSPI